MPVQPSELVEKVLEFDYQGVARKVTVEKARWNGAMILITGADEARNNQPRNFNLDPYEFGNTIHIIPNGWDHL